MLISVKIEQPGPKPGKQAFSVHVGRENDKASCFMV